MSNLPKKLSDNQPVSKQQKRLLKLVLVNGMSIGEAARKSGYSTIEAGYLAYANLRKRLGNAQIDVGLPIERLLVQKLIPLLDAKATKFFQSNGVIMETRDVEALGIQSRVAMFLAQAADDAARDAERETGHSPSGGGFTVNLVIADTTTALAVAERLASVGRYNRQPVLDAGRVDQDAGRPGQ